MIADNYEITSFTITYHSGALQTFDSFFTFRTYISRKGTIRLTFERDGIKRHGSRFEGEFDLPWAEAYEYCISSWEMEEKIFRRFDLLELQSRPEEHPGCDMGFWTMLIRTKGKSVKLEGVYAPEPFGRELSEAIHGLLRFERGPVIF